MTGFDSKRRMAQDKEALRLALEALEKKAGSWGVGQEMLNKAAIAAIKEALAQPHLPAQEQEPDELTIAYMSGLYDGKKAEREACAKACDSLEEQCEKLLVPDEKWPTPSDCAHIIRARGNT
jgi:hypothetical protein